MRTPKFLFVCILSVAFATLLRIANSVPVGRYTGPHSLGPYRIENDVSMSNILSVFGGQAPGKEIYCFKDVKHGLFLYVKSEHDRSGRVAEVFLSSFPNCEGYRVHASTIDPEVWKTPEGVGIGSSRQQVQTAYGKPAKDGKIDPKLASMLIARRSQDLREEISAGDTWFLYNCAPDSAAGCKMDNRATQFGLKGDKVIWVDISNTE